MPALAALSPVSAVLSSSTGAQSTGDAVEIRNRNAGKPKQVPRGSAGTPGTGPMSRPLKDPPWWLRITKELNRAPFNYDELEEVRGERLEREEVVRRLEHLEHLVRKHEKEPGYMSGGSEAKISGRGGATAPYGPPIDPESLPGKTSTKVEALVRKAAELLESPGALIDQFLALESWCDRLTRLYQALGGGSPPCAKQLDELRFGLMELRARLWQDLELLRDGYSPDGQVRSEEDMQDEANGLKGKINEINAALGDELIR